jgi:N-acyl-L-homoserine lactone synthetase
MFEVRRIRDDVELAGCQRLRARIYVDEKGWVPSERLVDGCEIDADDATSIHVGAFDGRAGLVGTFRIIPRLDRLPVERMFGVQIPAGLRTAELSRLAVLPDHRDSVIFIALCRWLYRHSLETGLDELYAAVEEPFLHSLESMGFPLLPIGEPRYVYNSWNYPARCRRVDVLSALAAADQDRFFKLAPFFAADEVVLPASRPDIRRRRGHAA